MARGSLDCGAASGALALTLALFVACSSDDKPSSLVTGAGASSSGGHSSANGGSADTAAGGTTSGGSSSTSDGGALDEGGAASAMPRAEYPHELEADVGCNMVTPDASLLIRNVGNEPLLISSAHADSGYIVKSTLPLEIAAGAGTALLVTPPPPSASADAGAVSTGKLSFTTNEPGTPSHEVTLTTTVFEGRFEFTDSSGVPVPSLKLSYGSGSACPDLTKYRLHNTGNVTFSVQGPLFPAHFAGSDLGANGQAIPPDGYAELIIGPASAPGGACSGTGDLSFTVMGAFCGNAPKLSVSWPLSADPDAGANCACTTALDL